MPLKIQIEAPSPRGMVLEGRPFGTRLGLNEVMRKLSHDGISVFS